ncbi:MAG: helix-turn-helix domain-containing protein [Anaerolineae bacterium]|nr:helix-turn-helix domain-containing protein [Anaerolineae bacterium]
MARQVTVTEAAAILGVSRKTVKNLIAAGKLTATKIGRLRLVDLPDEVVLPTEPKPTAPEPPPAPDAALLAAQLAQAQAELEAVKSERDYLRAHVAQLTQNVSALTATIYQVTEQKALPAPRPRERAWWQFWRREEGG